LNRDGRFRKPLLYPFEVQGHSGINRTFAGAFVLLTMPQTSRERQPISNHLFSF
jgi:hypothetical protein